MKTGYIISKFNINSEPYKVFIIDGLELLLFGKRTFFDNSVSISEGNVCTKVYNETETYIPVGKWNIINSELKFHVYQLGTFQAKPLIANYYDFNVFETFPENSLRKKAYDALINQTVPDNTELSNYLLKELFKD